MFLCQPDTTKLISQKEGTLVGKEYPKTITWKMFINKLTNVSFGVYVYAENEGHFIGAKML